MKRSVKWVLWAVVALAVVLVAGRMLAARKAQQATPATPAASAAAPAAIELAAGDVVTAQPRDMTQGLPLSGSIKAVNSAAVKARVAGELQGLTLREGDSVKAGQIVARVDPAESQSRVRQAQEQADAARAQIDIAQRQWDNNKALVDQGFISRTALDTSANNLAAAQATMQDFTRTIQRKKEREMEAMQFLGGDSSTSSADSSPVRNAKVGRNDPCPCGSGKKYKQCHGK